MVNKSTRTRVPSNGTPPNIDGIAVENELLLDLPPNERDVIFSKLTFLPLRTHEVLREPRVPIRFGYFMNSGLTSILDVMEDGKSVEVGLTGKEGFVSDPLLVGLSTSPTRAEVQIDGSAFRIRAADLELALQQCPVLERRLQRFVQAMAMQGTQVAACNRLHEVNERLARWLLMSQDRVGSDNVHLTQEFLAHMLGTRRSSVTVAAGILQRAGLITYTRGSVHIENRAGLESAACECYGVMLQQTKNWQGESK
jgi:CRP-like cAMP-binding protein